MLRGATLLRSALALGGGLGLRRVALSSGGPPPDAQLGSLWASALDGMIDVPGADGLASADGVLYLAPSPAAEARRWPAAFADGHHPHDEGQNTTGRQVN